MYNWVAFRLIGCEFVLPLVLFLTTCKRSTAVEPVRCLLVTILADRSLIHLLKWNSAWYHIISKSVSCTSLKYFFLRTSIFRQTRLYARRILLFDISKKCFANIIISLTEWSADVKHMFLLLALTVMLKYRLKNSASTC